MPITTISPAAVHAAQQEGLPLDLIDVRTPAERAEVHARGSRAVALDVAAEDLPKDRPVYVLCAGGMRARNVSQRLAAAGLDNVKVVEGGTNAWVAAGLPVVRGAKAAFGIERQVRSIIGGAVLTGALLAWFVHPGWIWLSAFFGAGLLMAGITNFCGLALVVAAMPWNRTAVQAGTCCKV
jgi:rhodanese-related sulfurtransferase